MQQCVGGGATGSRGQQNQGTPPRPLAAAVTYHPVAHFGRQPSPGAPIAYQFFSVLIPNHQSDVSYLTVAISS